MVFLAPIVKEFESTNTLFQATKANPEDMVQELDILHKALKSRLKDSCGNDLALSLVDFGAKFSSVKPIGKREWPKLIILSFIGRCQEASS